MGQSSDQAAALRAAADALDHLGAAEDAATAARATHRRERSAESRAAHIEASQRLRDARERYRREHRDVIAEAVPAEPGAATIKPAAPRPRRKG